jgi:two-component system sensor histidine kinase BaeS
MTLKFRHKVFLAFLLNGLLIVISMVIIVPYFATRNFENYIGKVEMERLGDLAKVLAREYKKSGNWNFVRDNPDQWLRSVVIWPGPPPGVPEGPPPMPPLMADHKPDGGPDKKGPPPFGDLPPFGMSLPLGGPPHRPDDAKGPKVHGVPVALFDAEKRPLSRGASVAGDYRLKSVEVDGHLVGWLGAKRFEQPTHPLDMEFLRRQSQNLYATGGIALLVALIVTFVLSRHLLDPVKRLATGTRALASRRFDTRIEVKSRDEFGQLASDFNYMAQSLERFEQMRRQWIADISHELRTPLAILRGEIEAMQDGIREVTGDALDSLHFEVAHLGRIVHDLHDLSLIESRNFDSDRVVVNPVEVLDETLRSFRARFEQRGTTIEAHLEGTGEARVMADTGRLKQLFSNLFENTLRYSVAPGTLTISSRVASGCLVLCVEDSGPGVPEESLSRLFDRLYRVDKARSRAQGGSGLGLAICKSITESFDGRIEACNAPSGGLRITMTFPVC